MESASWGSLVCGGRCVHPALPLTACLVAPDAMLTATYGLDLAADVIKPRARSAPMMFVLRCVQPLCMNASRVRLTVWGHGPLHHSTVHPALASFRHQN